ncbi:hypothetical protein CNY89_22000, partial [Amaricoccus sp. HAR-UPW-R2A-40]
GVLVVLSSGPRETTLRNPHLTLAKPLKDRDPTSRTGPDVICFSHLRWDFVLQRPQHLMQRFAHTSRVFFVEEIIPTDHHLPYLEFHAFEGTSVTAVRHACLITPTCAARDAAGRVA